MIGVVPAAQNGAFPAALFPAGLVIQGAAASADNGNQVVAIQVFLDGAGTNGTVQTELVSLGDIIFRDADKLICLLIHDN
jgi:hypothetical protein